LTTPLSNPHGAAAIRTPPTSTPTIADDDPAPSLTIADLRMNEGNSGTTNILFPVTLSTASPVTTMVQYYTSSSYAYAGEDFQYTSGTLTFTPGETQKTIAVAISGDTNFENDETFYVYLYSSTNATITKSYGIGTIVNDDARPTIAVSDIRVVEGNAGTTNAVVTLTASQPLYG